MLELDRLVLGPDRKSESIWLNKTGTFIPVDGYDPDLLKTWFALLKLASQNG